MYIPHPRSTGYHQG